MLSCGKDRTIRLWNPRTGFHIKSYTGHGYEVRDVAIQSDNRMFVSCGVDRQIFVWDVGTGRVVRKFRGHDSVVDSVTYGGEEQVVISGGADKAVKVWDCRAHSSTALQAMSHAKDGVSCVAATGQGEIIASSIDGCVRRYDLRMGAVLSDYLGPPVSHVAPTADGYCLLAACCDSTLYLLDKQGGQVLQLYRGHKHEGVKLEGATAAGDAFVLAGSEDGRVVMWDLVQAAKVREWGAHSGVVCSLAVHDEAGLLATAGVDGSICVWGSPMSAASK